MIRYNPRSWGDILLRFRGTVLPRVLGRVVLVAGVAAAATALREGAGVDLSIPGVAHAMVGVALGLLLVFRTNASYDRYWEGRALLGKVVNSTRNFARQVRAYVAPEARRPLAAGLEIWLVTVRHTLRQERDFQELADRLDPERLAALEQAASPPLVAAAWLSERIAAECEAGRLTEMRLRILDATLSALVDVWGGAERIVKTPVPFAYAHHIKSFLTLFCLTAPLALLSSMEVFTPLAAAVVAYGLYGIDEIGIEIEDPFGRDANDLPMDEIFDGLVIQLDEVVKQGGACG